MSAALSADYRPEIDGLRALAVLPVVFFHAGWERFGGGFVGVDVFFVISGYLITSMIVKEHERGTFSLVDFYERRARRLLPALMLVSFVCLPFAWFWMLPADMKRFSESLVAVCVFASNIFFWKTSGYFETSAELKPLLHTWSLAVEEQFYLLFPVFLLLLLGIGRKRPVWLPIGVIALASLGLAQWMCIDRPAATFYLLPTRLWELLVGALAAYAYAAMKRSRASLLAQQTGSVIGLAGIGCSIVAFDKGTPFPSLYALVPTLGAALVILFASAQTWVGRLLRWRVLVGLGLISYSAYLWHQPLLAFTRYRSLEPPGGLVLSIAVLGALALAYLSWRFVEIPWRRKNTIGRRSLFASIGCAGIGLAVFGAIGHATSGYAFRTPMFEELVRIKTIEDAPCHIEGRRTAKQIASGDICTLGGGKTATFAVIGDSHAGALFHSLAHHPGAESLAFQAFSGGYCAPIIGFRMVGLPLEDCVATTHRAFERIIASEQIRTVVLVAEWANYTKGFKVGRVDKGIAIALDDEGAATSPAENAKIFERALARTVATLQAANKNVVIVGPVPEFEEEVLPYVGKQRHFAREAAVFPRVSLAVYQARNREVIDALAKLQGVRYVDSSALFCTEAGCPAVDASGRILFSDSNHVTEHGAELIAYEVMKRVAP